MWEPSATAGWMEQLTLPSAEAPRAVLSSSASASALLPALLDARGQALGAEALTSSEGFSAAAFLSAVHSETPLAELEGGLEELRLFVDSSDESLRALVTRHTNEFFRCKDVIDELGAAVGADEQSGEVRRLVDAIRAKGDELHSPLLSGRSETERRRTVLGVLRKFRHVFEIPTVMRASVEVGDYEKVVKEYRRARLLSRDSASPIVAKVCDEVEAIASRLRERLLKTLARPGAMDQAAASGHVRLIQCLRDLDCEVDPVRHFLESRQKSVVGELSSVAQEFEAKVEADARHAGQQAEGWAGGADSAGVEAQDGEEDLRARCRHRFAAEYLERLSEILVTHVPTLRQQGAQLFDIADESDDERQSMRSRLRGLLLGILKVYDGRVRAMVGTKVELWDPSYAVLVRATYVALATCKPSASAEELYLLIDLDSFVSQTFARHCWARATEQVLALAGAPAIMDACGVVTTAESGQYDVGAVEQSDIAAENTVEQFAEIVHACLGQLDGVCDAAEPQLCEQLCSTMCASLQEVCCSMLDCVHSAMFDPDDSSGPRTRQQILLALGLLRVAKTAIAGFWGELPVAIRSSRDSAQGAVLEHRQVTNAALQHLFGLLISEYSRQTSRVLRLEIRDGIATNGCDLGAAPPPHHIRPFAVQVLTQCVFIHAELAATIPESLGPALSAAFESIAVELCDSVTDVLPLLRENSSSQLLVEIEFLLESLDAFASQQAAVQCGRCKAALLALDGVNSSQQRAQRKRILSASLLGTSLQRVALSA